MEFGLYLKGNGFAENVKHLKKNLLKWLVKIISSSYSKIHFLEEH